MHDIHVYGVQTSVRLWNPLQRIVGRPLFGPRSPKRQSVVLDQNPVRLWLATSCRRRSKRRRSSDSICQQQRARRSQKEQSQTNVLRAASAGMGHVPTRCKSQSGWMKSSISSARIRKSQRSIGWPRRFRCHIQIWYSRGMCSPKTKPRSVQGL